MFTGINPMMLGSGKLTVDNFFATTLANGASVGTVFPLKFAPHLNWYKDRTNTSNHILLDSVRPDQQLNSNLSSAQSSLGATGYSPDGSKRSLQNTSANDVVWPIRQASKFFNIVTYTGNAASSRSISHNLGSIPGMVIIKRLDSAAEWAIIHRSISPQTLNFTSNPLTNNPSISASAPDVNNFYIGNNSGVNANGGSYIAYIFAHETNTEGMIQCGTYTGNGSATGPVVTLGWEPQFVMIKNATQTSSWTILDNKRSTTNPRSNQLYPNITQIENNVAGVDFLSTGFQPKTTSNLNNQNGQQIIYMAIRKGKL